MSNVTVSLKALYDKFDGQLKYGEIIKELQGVEEYYDLYTDKGLACLDGEVCKVVGDGDLGYVLLNTDGEVDVTFVLTNEEYDTGVVRNVL